MSLALPTRDLKLCYVTDRKALAAAGAEQIRLLLGKIEKAAQAGVDWIQIREKDLSGRDLAALVTEALRRAQGACRILVNDRLDVAIACGAGGAHLGEHSIPAKEARELYWKRNVSGDFMIGVSVHSLPSGQAAQQSDADYVIFGPVFATPSKAGYGPQQGIDQLARVSESVRIPVIAIGGITADNAEECAKAGAAGIAAIRMFQDASDVTAVVRKLRGK